MVSFGSPLLLNPKLYTVNQDGSIWYEADHFLNNFPLNLENNKQTK